MANAAPEQTESEAAATDAQGLAQARSAADGLDKRRYVLGMFSDIAPRYDLLNHLLSMNIDKAWRRKALRKLNWTAKPKG
ncbi:MAG: class I SAM-dependent methyltransferase, partial [Roseiflexaceae bacterium]